MSNWIKDPWGWNTRINGKPVRVLRYRTSTGLVYRVRVHDRFRDDLASTSLAAAKRNAINAIEE